MKDWIEVIIGLIIVGLVLAFFVTTKPLSLILAIIGLIVGGAAFIFADVAWGRFIIKTL